MHSKKLKHLCLSAVLSTALLSSNVMYLQAAEETAQPAQFDMDAATETVQQDQLDMDTATVAVQQDQLDEEVTVEEAAPKADGTYHEITVSSVEALEQALNEAKDSATAERPYKITMTPGSYNLDRGLHIYGNTYLHADGVTFTLKSGLETNMLKVGESLDTQSGYYYKNITVYGGVWNANGGSNTVIKVGHAQNFNMQNMTVQNAKDAHLMEVAGVDGLTIKNCTFKDQSLAVDARKRFYEAIQIDILLNSHLVGYRSEDLAMKNITVSGCTFSNVPRGVGSHTAILNNYVDNVTITNNTFTNMKSAAIQCRNYTNCNISNNVIKNAPRGIAFYSLALDGTFLSSTAAKEGSTAASTSTSYVKPATNQNITITGNTITTSGEDPYAGYENVGILVGGLKLDKDSKDKTDGDLIPKGDYYVSGVTIKGNTISTIGHGIRLQDTKNSTVSDNRITHTGNNPNGNYYGIQLREASTNTRINNNTVKNMTVNGIFLNDASSAPSINGNTVDSAGKYGIALENASASSISENSITKSGVNGIYLFRKSSAGDIQSNTITSPKNTGINLDNSTTVDKIASNQIQSPGLHGMYLHGQSVVKNISGNIIRSTGKYGIFVSAATASKIEKNKITSTKQSGIFIQSGGKVKAITSNTITSAKHRGIAVNSVKCDMKVNKNKVSKCSNTPMYLNPKSTTYTVTIQDNQFTGKKNLTGIHAATGKVCITGNTIKSCNRAILLSEKARGTVMTNKFSKNTYNNARIAGKDYKNLKKVAPSATATGKSSITVKWKKVSGASSYTVYRAASKNGKYKKCTICSSASFKDTNLKAGKTYYYKVVPSTKDHRGKVTIMGPDSKIVSAKAK